MRYYVAYHRGGLEELSKEMHFGIVFVNFIKILLDLNRLWIRNLGRDDRAISDNGKECRYPFLDEIVVNGLSKVNFKYLTNFDLPKGGGGEKFLLRKLSKSLGLKYYFYWHFKTVIGKVLMKKKELYNLEQKLQSNSI